MHQMPDLKSIPDDVKWRLAADCAARLPALYDVAFRKVLGEKYDEIEREIWIELSRRAIYHCTGSLDCPIKNAHDLAESMRIGHDHPFWPGATRVRPLMCLKTAQLFSSNAARSLTGHMKPVHMGSIPFPDAWPSRSPRFLH